MRTGNVTRALLETFKYLSTATIAQVVPCVSKKWASIAAINELWTYLLYRDSGHDYGFYATPFSDAKSAYCLALHQSKYIAMLTSFPCSSFLIVNPESMKGRRVTVGSLLLEKNSSWCYLPMGGVLISGGCVDGVTSRKSSILVGAMFSLVECGNMREAREAHSLCRVEHVVFAFGGQNYTCKLATCEKFQIKTQQWEQIASLPMPESYICSAYMKGQGIFLLHCSGFLKFRLPAETFESVSIRLFSSLTAVAMLAYKTDLVIIGEEFGVKCDVATMTQKHRFKVLPAHLVYGASWVQIANKSYSPLSEELVLSVDLASCTMGVCIPLR